MPRNTSFDVFAGHGDSFQDALGILPAFVPSKVEEIPIDQRLIAPWVAIELRKLLTSTTKSAARLSGVALTQSLRAKMRVSDETSLIVLLHGNDNLLERFWEMDRQPFYQQLLKHNINAIMGTTFSLYNEGRLRPASHNVMQLRRHSHVLHELSSYGLTYIPNLYLRAVKDEVELAAWLRDRTDIRQVARDLSMNKTWRAKEVELDLLARALDRTARNFNVLVTGVSIGTYREVVSHLHKNGHTCTVVTPDPIMKAHHGRNLASRLEVGLPCTSGILNAWIERSERSTSSWVLDAPRPIPGWQWQVLRQRSLVVVSILASAPQDLPPAQMQTPCSP